jgi:hypothetical protein
VFSLQGTVGPRTHISGNLTYQELTFFLVPASHTRNLSRTASGTAKKRFHSDLAFFSAGKKNDSARCPPSKKNNAAPNKAATRITVNAKLSMS